MRKGTVVLVPFPFTDLSGQKIRPALILQASPRGEDCIVVFISSHRSKRLLEFEVTVPASKDNGLKVDSIVKVDKMATLHKQTVLGEIGTLETTVLHEVEKKLTMLFHL